MLQLYGPKTIKRRRIQVSCDLSILVNVLLIWGVGKSQYGMRGIASMYCSKNRRLASRLEIKGLVIDEKRSLRNSLVTEK